MPDATTRRRHLLDPDDLRGSHQRSVGTTSGLTKVQRWVMSVLAVTTLIHFAVGLSLAALVVDASRLDARIGLNVLAGITGVLSVAAGRAIHGKGPASPWLLLGLVPGLVGAALVFA